MWCKKCTCSTCQTSAYEQIVYDRLALHFVAHNEIPSENFGETIRFRPVNPSDYPDGYPSIHEVNIMNFLYDLFSRLKIKGVKPGDKPNKCKLNYDESRAAFNTVAAIWGLDRTFDRIRHNYYSRDIRKDIEDLEPRKNKK